MSSPLAIAAVTAVLKDLLNNGLVDHDLAETVGTVVVHAKPPGAIKVEGTDRAELNLFMYMVTPNTAWCNAGMPAYDARGSRLSNPPLALDLHYLLTAYGQTDFQAEILLGYAMHLLHEQPILTRGMIAQAFKAPQIDPSRLPPLLKKLSAADLAEQVESIKITPEYLNTEELSKLWSAFQTFYRPTVGYRASVVLIEAARQVRAPLPVLEHRLTAQPDRSPQPPLFPTLTAIAPPGRQPAARLEDGLSIYGHHLDGDEVYVLFDNPRLKEPIVVTLTHEAIASSSLQVRLPKDRGWVAGIYSVSASVKHGDGPERTTNALPLALAPRLMLPREPIGSGGMLSIGCVPAVKLEQKVSLLLGEREIAPMPRSEVSDSLQFPLNAIEPGSYRVRLRVDGVESFVIDHSTPSPRFDESQKVEVGA